LAASETFARPGAPGLNEKPDTDLIPDLDLMLGAAREAGRIALGFFRSDNRVWMKSGNSPVSQADMDVDAYLRAALTGARPGYGWMSEETLDSADRLDREHVFVVDPIDGTRGFLEGDPQWCVSVALVRAGRPVAAVLHCPALERTFHALSGGGAWLNGAALTGAVRPGATDAAAQSRLTGSRRLNAEIDRLYPGRFAIAPYIPSLAYRLALVATGELDGAYARSGSHDWDLAAADLVLSEAGGDLTALDGSPLVYNDPATRNPALIAAGAGRHGELLRLAKSGGFLH